MLSSRYLHLHEALGLGPMWLKRGARVVVEMPEPVENVVATGLQVASIDAGAQDNRLPEARAPLSNQHDVAPHHQPIAAQTAVRHDAVADTSGLPQANDADEAHDASPWQAIRAELKQNQAYQSHHDAQIVPSLSPLAQAKALWQTRVAVPENVADCTACGLHQERRQALMSPSKSAKLMVISLNPALQDDDEGQLFAGSHGRLLANMLTAIGLTRDDAHDSTWLRCAPRVRLTPSLEEQIACTAHLQAEIARQRPQALLLLGEKFADDVQQWLLQQAAPDVPHFIVPHPAVLLQNPLQKARVWPILQKLRAALSV